MCTYVDGHVSVCFQDGRSVALSYRASFSRPVSTASRDALTTASTSGRRGRRNYDREGTMCANNVVNISANEDAAAGATRSRGALLHHCPSYIHSSKS
jgi:hypothetical protein